MEAKKRQKWPHKAESKPKINLRYTWYTHYQHCIIGAECKNITFEQTNETSENRLIFQKSVQLMLQIFLHDRICTITKMNKINHSLSLGRSGGVEQFTLQLDFTTPPTPLYSGEPQRYAKHPSSVVPPMQPTPDESATFQLHFSHNFNSNHPQSTFLKLLKT